MAAAAAALPMSPSASIARPRTSADGSSRRARRGPTASLASRPASPSANAAAARTSTSGSCRPNISVGTPSTPPTRPIAMSARRRIAGSGSSESRSSATDVAGLNCVARAGNGASSGSAGTSGSRSIRWCSRRRIQESFVSVGTGGGAGTTTAGTGAVARHADPVTPVARTSAARTTPRQNDRAIDVC